MKTLLKVLMRLGRSIGATLTSGAKKSSKTVCSAIFKIDLKSQTLTGDFDILVLHKIKILEKKLAQRDEKLTAR